MVWSLLDTKTGSASAATSVTATFDSAPSAGQLLTLAVDQNVASQTFTPPTGYVLARTKTNTLRTLSLYVKVADGTEAAAQTVTAGTSGNLILVAQKRSHTAGFGTTAQVIGDTGSILSDVATSAPVTNTLPAIDGALLLTAGRTTQTSGAFDGGYGNLTSVTGASAKLYVADKTSAGAVESSTLTLTGGTDTRAAVLLVELFPASILPKQIAVDIGGASSAVAADGKYYNRLIVNGTLVNITDAQNVENTSATGWSVTTNNAFATGSSTATGYSGDLFSSDVMLTFSRLNGSGDNVGQITVSGLDNAKTYNLIFGAHAGSAADAMNVTIDGVTKTATANNTLPVGEVCSFYGVSPSSSSIVIAFASAGAGNADLGAFRVVENPPSGRTGDMAVTESGPDTFAGTGGLANNGVRLTLRDTDTGALATSLTGLIVSIRATSQASSLLIAAVTNETTDGSGVLEVANAAIGDVTDWVYVTVEKSDNSIVATYRVQVIDLNA